MLGVLTAEQLAHAMFPLGATPSKAEVRAEAAARGLAVAHKPDSHDICFIPDGDTRGWLADHVAPEPGEIVDRDGAVVGSHEGAIGFTVGQRRGLALGVPDAGRQDRASCSRCGRAPTRSSSVPGGAGHRRISGERFSWAGLAARRSDDTVPLRRADPRARRSGARCGLRLCGGRASRARRHARMIRSIGVAPGQTAVVYVGTRVLGQCTIDRTVSAVPATVG